MDTLDLNIKNYELNDILNLFNLDYDYTFKELKQAFKIVAKTHPDKSNLSSKYFLFFKKAYSVLLEIYKVRNKKNVHRDDFHDNEHEILCEKLSKHDDFNNLFNKMFEETAGECINKENGYEDWFKQEDENNDKLKNISEMGEYFKKKKKESRELVKHKDIQELNNGSYMFNLSGTEPEEYSAGIFSKLNYEDLKKAHTETVVPVTEEDYYNKEKFRNVDHLQRHRKNQDITPMNKKDANNYLEEKLQKENQQDMQKMYSLIRQDEQVKEINNQWWGKIRQLKN